MMAEFPALPLFTDAYLADTMHLSLVEHGAYLKLLMIAWRSPDCTLPADDERIARMLSLSPAQWAKIRPAVMAFWTLDANKFSQKKLQKTFVGVREKVTKNRQNAAKGGKAKALKNNNKDLANGTNSLDVSLEPDDSETSSVGLPNQNQILLSKDNSPDPDRIVAGDFKKICFDVGVKLLTSAGSKESTARTCIGGWLKTYGPEATASAIEAASRNNAVNPKAYITSILKKAAAPVAQTEWRDM